jgi:hypothetical protein
MGAHAVALRGVTKVFLSIQRNILMHRLPFIKLDSFA